MQLIAAPGLHVEVWLQVSVPLQKIPSSQSVLLRHSTQDWVASLQIGVGAGQTTTSPGWQPEKMSQVSVPLQNKPSSQARLFARFSQLSVARLQRSVVQAMLSVQLTAEPAMQVPATQDSVPLQKIGSVQSASARQSTQRSLRSSQNWPMQASATN